tara:strand:- start:1319 stop:1636 length:318 start_codon:yes stop_codon:yes gene_type:complete
MIFKFHNIIILLFLFTFANNINAEETKRDCSQYSTKTFSGLTQKMRCKKGLPPLKKSFFKSLEYNEWKETWKKKNNYYVPGKPCNEYSTKTLAGLRAKIKCKREK